MKPFEDFAIGDISLDGFQTVKGHYFSRQLEPYMIIRETSIAFSASAYQALNCVANVHIMVNQTNRKIVVRPVSSEESDSISWIKNSGSPKSKPIECTAFTRPLYDIWKWHPKTKYKVYGRLVKSEKKLMLLFDFSAPEIIPPNAKAV